MGNQIQLFTNDVFGTIRTITNDGQILFCGKDVATALGYQDPTNAVKLHCRGAANYHPIEDALGRTQNARFVTEGDLYRLIIFSKLSAAQKFETWVFDEMLPTIRRHGMYAYDEPLADDEVLEHAIATLRTERTKRLAAEQALLQAAPKVSYYDVVLQSDSLLTTTAIAKDYGMSAKKLNRILREEGVQFYQSGRWFLYAKYAEQGYTQSKTHEYGYGQTRTHMYWTQKGRLFIYDLLKNQLGILSVIEREGQVQA
ncbi:phage antirepressor KilAC domain-containing protein [Corynebacterium sp. TAE3-ERU2]|uniref:phage antirepressor n=1 Tax=Corynebacterium sp. TAE3-ERU2 TaxID=2849497 RepID=UPI001C44A5E2|nr:phage antirepressor KilAC domain-containing protein [Corynebacterium sp. TAE3-ERU2]MBV7302168.1 phage antirepressor KilAC domain-containing protein [Corynebacterium sp. TAE3-ERU2]